MHFHLISLFPEFFNSPLQMSLMAKAQANGLISIDIHNPREHGYGLHKAVDDRPYGGGPGMVFMLEPLLKTLRSIPKTGRILVLSPAGKPFNQSMAKELAHEEHLTLVCGRYEGIDARLADILPVEYVSMGDMVLNGGEVPALAIMESIARLIPGFMGKDESGTEESFAKGLLEYPHYTRPETFEGHSVPAVLRGGDHQKIAAWRREQSLALTLSKRPDIFNDAELKLSDVSFLNAQPRTRAGRNLYIALVHHPVIIEGKYSGTSSLTNLDIHDISRLARTYGLGGFYVITPLKDQQDILNDILQHWLHGPAKKNHADRTEALSLVHPAMSIEEAINHMTTLCGRKPLMWGSSAQWGESIKSSVKGPLPDYLSFAAARDELQKNNALLLLGTGHGLAPEVLQSCDGLLRPVRFLGDYNHLSVRSAAAIMLDRILQDIY